MTLQEAIREILRTEGTYRKAARKLRLHHAQLWRMANKKDYKPKPKTLKKLSLRMEVRTSFHWVYD